MTYNPNIPNPTDFLSDSQPQIKNNFSAANTSFGIDHTPFTGVTNIGFHKPVHLISQGTSNPTAVAGTNIVYAKSYTPDTAPASGPDIQLFARTAAGGISQLTGNSAAKEGYQWIGGVLLQWGRVTQNFAAGSTSGTVTFKSRSPGNSIPFPNACFIVQTTPFINAANPNSQASIQVRNSTLSETIFDWQFYTNSTDYKGFYWMAIGN